MQEACHVLRIVILARDRQLGYFPRSIYRDASKVGVVAITIGYVFGERDYCRSARGG
jgi:hypothetical protein